MRLLPVLALAAASLAASAAAQVGRWHSWSNVNPVKVMLEHKGRLFVGTTGGVRSIDPATLAEKDYDNLAGLTDVRVVGLAEDADARLWAATRSGQLFRLDGQAWTGFGRSYMAEGWTVNDRAFLAVGGYLVFGSEKGLTFFDRKKGISAVNLTRFGAAGQQGVTGLHRSGDTLWIATGKAVFKAAVDWGNVLSTRFGTLYDPQIWKPADDLFPPDSLPMLAKRAARGRTAFRGAAGDTIDPPVDTLPVVPADTSHRNPVHLALLDGKLTAHDTGTYLAGPFRVKALRNRRLAIDGRRFADSTVEVAYVSGGKLFLGSPEALMLYRDGKFDTLKAPLDQPQGTVAAIAAHGGIVAAQTVDMVWRFDGKSWTPYFGFGSKTLEILRNELRNVRVTPEGDFWMGDWGHGVIRRKPDSVRQWTAKTDKDCLEPFGEGIFTVILALDIRGKDVWIASLHDGNGAMATVHNLSHLDMETGAVTCPAMDGPGPRATSVRILGDDLLGVASDAGIHLYRWGLRDGQAFATPLGALKTDFGQVLGRDLAMDSRGRVWALYSEQLGYVDSLEDRIKAGNLQVKYPANLKVKTCRDMEVDARRQLWVGCDNGLFHVRPGADPEEPEVDHHNADNGLLSNRVFDVGIDRTNGDVWVASEGGISRLESSSPPLAQGVAGARAYPNPFLGRHALLVLDNLPPGAVASILTQSGDVVRRFRSAEMRGNQYQWDGNNAAGRRVKPGVYFYSVTGDGGTARGKIIVAR